MPVTRPQKIMEDVARLFPGAFSLFDLARSQRDKAGGWPDFCFVPGNASVSIAEATGKSTKPADIGMLQMVAAWRQTQGIYRFHPSLLTELLDTELTGDIPAELLKRMPEWCVYIEVNKEGLYGFFAEVFIAKEEKKPFLGLLLDSESGLHAVSILLDGDLRNGIIKGSDLGRINRPSERITSSFAGFISLLLFLCSEGPETRPTRDPARKHERPEVRAVPGKKPRTTPKKLEIWETGFSLGVALERASSSGVSCGTVRPHVRRAHWHSFWVGPVDGDRELRIKWLPPIRVKMDDVVIPTLRRVG